MFFLLPHLATVCLYPEVASIHALATRCLGNFPEFNKNVRDKQRIEKKGKNERREKKRRKQKSSVEEKNRPHLWRVKQPFPTDVFSEPLDERGNCSAHSSQCLWRRVLERRGLGIASKSISDSCDADVAAAVVVVARRRRRRRC